MRSQVIGVLVGRCNSGDVLNSWDISQNDIFRPSVFKGRGGGVLTGYVEPQVVVGLVGRCNSGDVPNSWDISQNDIFRVFFLKGGRLGAWRVMWSRR
jgi:hypothetical protein